MDRLIEELLLDFDVYHVRDPSDLLHYADAKCLPAELGGRVPPDVETWLELQQHVEGFSLNARRIGEDIKDCALEKGSIGLLFWNG